MADSAADTAMREYYERRAPEYDDWYLRRGLYRGRVDLAQWERELTRLGERIDALHAERILEIAPGTGWWTRHLARRAAVTALEFSPAMIAVARARLAEEKLAARIVRGDTYALPFRSRAFNGCFFGFFLSHVPHSRLEGFLAEVARVLRPGGLVMMFDSASTGEEADGAAGVERLNERTLSDGSRHRVIKTLHSPETLAKALEPLGQVMEAWSTGTFFVGAVVRVGRPEHGARR